MKRQRLAILLVVALLFVPFSTARFAAAQSATAKWTIMVYIAADNDLEPNSIVNLMEMAMVGSTKDLNIVVQITRPPNYSGIYGEWGGTRRFLITKSDGGLSAGDFQISPTRLATYLEANADRIGLTPDKVQQITRGPRTEQEQTAQQLFVPVIDKNAPLAPIQVSSVQDLGDKVNSGDGATLADFGVWAAQNYPAERYGLIIWNHGGGWSMIASDDTLGPRGIAMPALQQALATITQATKQKFEFIGFDACLMAQLPVLMTIKPFANYQIAAEELVPGLGWRYAPGLTVLATDPTSTTEVFAKATINGFITAYSTTLKAQGGNAFDLGLIDLSKVDPVVAALDKFTATVKASGDEFKNIATARANALTFAAVGGSSDTTKSIASIDLADFMRLIGTLSKNAEVKAAAKAVIDAVSTTVIYHKTSGLLTKAKGISVFFPAISADFENADGARYRDEFSTALPAWQAFLESYYGVTSANLPTITITNVSTTPEKPGSILDTPVITSSIDGVNLVSLDASIYYQLPDGTLALVDEFPVDSQVTTEDGSQISSFVDGVSTNDFYWNTKLFTLGDGKNTSFAVASSKRKDPQYAYVLGAYTNKATGKTSLASLLVDLDTGLSSSLWAQSNGTLAQLFPQPGDTFLPGWKQLDPATNSTQLKASPVELTFGKDPLVLQANPGYDGNYVILLTVTDAFGNEAKAVAPVQVKNSGLDPTLQNFKDIGLGISFLYPFSWTDAENFVLADGTIQVYFTDITGETALTVDTYSDVTSLDALVEKITPDIENNVDQMLTEPTAVTVGEAGIPAISLTYDYTDDNGEKVYGIAVAVYVEETQQSYVLKLETPSNYAESADTFMANLLKTVQFLAPAQ